MSKRNEGTRDIEKVLEAFYQTPDPSSNFLNALEMQLKETSQGRQGAVPEATPENLLDRILGKRRPRWAFAPAIIALMLVVAVVLIGPQQVLAQVQR
jgi:hypothetical protein